MGYAISLANNNTLHINDSVFYGNSGAILGELYCNISIIDTDFTHNKASYGGSIYVSMKTIVYLHSCSFTNNSAIMDGGVMNVQNSTVKVLACNFTRNMAKQGGVFTLSGTLFVIDSLIVNNIATNGDGAVAHLEENSLVNISNSTFRANLAFGSGGVLWIRKGTVNVWNSFFLQNQASISGGVIYAEYSSVIKISESICHN